MDEPFGGAPSNAIASNLQAMAQAGMTKRKLLDRMALGSRQAPIVGGPAAVADELLRWVTEADVDGFILSRTVTPECFEDFVDLVVPELQRRGVYRARYDDGALRHKLFGRGPRLPDTHAGRRARIG
jgi:alkanesulfonate monooxygenase SsuD/methylene tetrahydromethanopterin reductase-like flavin-dependent oxidoreductase (luciferase family)